MLDAITKFDLSVLNYIWDNLRTPFLDEFFSFITKFGNSTSCIIYVIVLILISKKTRKTGIMMGCSLLIGLLLGNLLLKNGIARSRPYDYAGNEFMRDLLFVHPETSYSFPSGHSLASFEIATTVFLQNKKIGIPLLVFAALIAFSRMYIYVHYPTDVITGALMGVGIGFLGCFITKKAYEKIGKGNNSNEI